VLGVNEVAYIILAVPLAMAGQVAAGFEHRGGKPGALRGLVAGALFGAAILAVHELTGKEAKAELPHPEIVLLAVTTLFGAGLGAIGGRWRADAEERGSFISFKEVSPAEFVGMASALVLFASLFLTWFSTDAKNNAANINGLKGDLTGWEVFTLLDPLLVAGFLRQAVYTAARKPPGVL
jgi:hypothetical protein